MNRKRNRSQTSEEKEKDDKAKNKIKKTVETKKMDINALEGERLNEDKKENIIKTDASKDCNEIVIPIIDDSNSLEPLTISKFLEDMRHKLLVGDISLEEYVKVNDVDDKNIILFLKNLINSEDYNTFYIKYEKYQYALKLTDRIEIQRIFQDKRNIPDIIKLNMINCSSIKSLFITICSNLIKINNATHDQILKVFSDNNVYFDQPIDLRFPNQYGTNEIQFFSLLSDIFFYFQKTKEDKVNLKEKYEKFVMLKYYIDRMHLLDCKDLISNTNYLVNMLYIFKEKGCIDLHIFSLIVKTCVPFDINVAKKAIKKLKDYEFDFYINNENFKSYKKEINENDLISFRMGKKTEVSIKAKFINWDIKKDIVTTLYSDFFMLAVKYPENEKYNYLTLDKDINAHVGKLFKSIIQSPPVKQAMLFDGEIEEYKYLYNNDDILSECEKNVHLIFFPFDGYNGYTDKKSYDVYINVAIKSHSPLTRTLADFKIFMVTKSHEFKHVSRIYMRLYKNINISTPIKKLSDFIGDKSYILRINENSINNIVNASINYSKDSTIFKKTIKEYGDFFEYSLFGYKIDPLFFYTVIFFLNEKTWKMSPQEFYNEYNKCMKDKKSKSINNL